MPVTTHIDQARTRVQAEREAVDAKRDAVETFLDRVAELPTDPTGSSPGITATANAQLHAETSTTDHCRTVRTAFAETIRPHSVEEVDDSEPLLETICSEFTDAIAVALAPTTETPFSEKLKRLIVSEAEARRTEAEVLRRALAREGTHLETAGDVVDDITSWIAEADETPLTDLDFERLQGRHETLASHRDRCDTLARERQEFLRESTNETVEIGVAHRSLPPYLYEVFPVDHPLLATVARLDAACAQCQRAVRTHLIRRV